MARPKNMVVKEGFDRVLSLAGLLVLMPVFLVIGIMISIFMPGPVFYRQKRVGQYGRLFTMYKFRSMKVGPETTTVTTDSDVRITPLGSFLRRSKLDELPELWNVLKGDMSFVGPRPDVPGYADTLTGEQRKILELKPGITGPASLKYAREEEILAKVDNPEKYNDEVIYPDKVKINLDYYYNWSMSKDLKIIGNTLFGPTPPPKRPNNT